MSDYDIKVFLSVSINVWQKRQLFASSDDSVIINMIENYLTMLVFTSRSQLQVSQFRTASFSYKRQWIREENEQAG